MGFYATPAPWKGYELVTDPIQDPYMSIARPLPTNEPMAEFDEKVAYYAQAVTQHNSTFLEIVDRNYAVRGIAAVLGIFCVCLFGFMLAAIISRENFSFGDFIFALLLPVPFIFTGLFILRFECFRYTHFPIRFNRKNRQVYVWRKDGSVWKVGWEDLFFFIRAVKDMGRDHDLSAVVFEEGTNRVVEGINVGTLHSVNPELVRGHFEYFRRYMEAGPEQTYRMLEKCMPVAKRRETWREGYLRMMAELGGEFSSFVFMILMQPFFIPVSIGRWIAMRTCKIPRWPDWVEQECAVDPNDPYVREPGYVYKG